MAQVTIENGRLTLHLEGIARFVHLNDEISVPVGHVVSVEARPEPPMNMMGHLGAMLGAGTHVPGLIKVGTFVGRDGRVFYALRHRSRAIVIELKDERFRRLIFDAPEQTDPQAYAEGIRSHLRDHGRTPPLV